MRFGKIQRWAWLSLLVPLALGAAAVSTAVVEVEGFRASFEETATPRTDWGGESEKRWVAGFTATLESQKPLAYRNQEIPAGKHDVWTERGKGDWYYLVVGDREQEDAPRLRAIFRLYEVDDGVEKLAFQLKLTRRATKLKFSILAGKSEGHGNLRIVDVEPK